MRKIIVAALIISVAGANAFAHSGATGIVKERMNLMSSISKNVKKIFVTLKDKSGFDADLIASSSREITLHAHKFPHMFPEGSTKHPSEAAPAIWERPEEFSKKAQDLITYSNELMQLAEAKSDHTAIDDAFGKVKSTCKACHADFRIKN